MTESHTPGHGHVSVHSAVVAGIIRLRVIGEIDAESAGSLTAAVDEHREASGAHAVELDLSSVSFLDSLGLGELLTVRRDLEMSGGSLSVIGVSPQVRRVLDITGLASSFGLDGPEAS